MKLKNTLPNRLNCASLEVALAVANFICATSERKLEVNLKPETWNQTPKEFGCTGTVMLSIEKGIVGRWCDNIYDKVDVGSLDEFIVRYSITPITIGEHRVEYRAGGIQVGCQYIPFTTIERILAERP